MEEAFGPQGWNGKWAALGFIHDEIQIAVRPEIHEEASRLALEAIAEAGILLGVTIPLAGKVTFGANWKETH